MGRMVVVVSPLEDVVEVTMASAVIAGTVEVRVMGREARTGEGGRSRGSSPAVWIGVVSNMPSWGSTDSSGGVISRSQSDRRF